MKATKGFRRGQVVKIKRTLAVIVKKLPAQRWRVLTINAEVKDCDEAELTPGAREDRQKLNLALAKIV